LRRFSEVTLKYYEDNLNESDGNSFVCANLCVYFSRKTDPQKSAELHEVTRIGLAVTIRHQRSRQQAAFGFGSDKR
jgi:hypothetical protein